MRRHHQKCQKGSCLTTSQKGKIEKIVKESCWYFWKFLVLPETCDAAYLFYAKGHAFWWTIAKAITNRYQKKFSTVKNSWRGPFGVSGISGTKKLCKTGVSQLLSTFFLSDSTNKVRTGTILCFWNSLVSKNFMHKRGYHDFPSKNFVSQYPKIS